MDLPHGTVTLLFSDVDGSTELLKRLGARYGEVLAEHRRLLRSEFAAQRGIEVDTQGDARDVAISVGVHSGEAGIGWLGPAMFRCEALCDAAEGGQIFLSSSAAALLEEEDLGDLAVRDLGSR
jgi:class 3 adenylate cyclase